jgi:hypothetical protein
MSYYSLLSLRSTPFSVYPYTLCLIMKEHPVLHKHQSIDTRLFSQLYLVPGGVRKLCNLVIKIQLICRILSQSNLIKFFTTSLFVPHCRRVCKAATQSDQLTSSAWNSATFSGQNLWWNSTFRHFGTVRILVKLWHEQQSHCMKHCAQIQHRRHSENFIIATSCSL